ncbi:MAG: hypothetical protein M1816_005069 [Peltula sp. TS41687]|nr:MAG: hypothetical protein M1816_005069 [Peltula sp. TS41687]
MSSSTLEKQTESPGWWKRHNPYDRREGDVRIICGLEMRSFLVAKRVICSYPYFAAACQDGARIELPSEDPDMFSLVVEYLKEGDYPPWSRDLENGVNTNQTTAEVSVDGLTVLKDTVIYGMATQYGLENLQTVALKKQNLRPGISASTLLDSARYAYERPLGWEIRAQILMQMIQSRNDLTAHEPMRLAMDRGEPFSFDLFVALCRTIEMILSLAETESSCMRKSLVDILRLLLQFDFSAAKRKQLNNEGDQKGVKEEKKFLSRRIEESEAMKKIWNSTREEHTDLTLHADSMNPRHERNRSRWDLLYGEVLEHPRSSFNPYGASNQNSNIQQNAGRPLLKRKSVQGVTFPVGSAPRTTDSTPAKKIRHVGGHNQE